uniref:DUF7619 domain-containing protein n=3 Tax=Flavobacterium sp. TaxID=239 RepID=UPI00404A923C
MKHLFTLFLVLSNFFVFAEPIIETPTDLIICQDETTVDLTIKNPEILGALNPADYTVVFFNTDQDAQNNISPIANPTFFLLSSFPQQIYVRVYENADTTNFALTSFSILAVDLNYTQPNDLVLVDDPFDGFGSFDLESQTPIISNGSSTLTVMYYETFMDAISGVNPINSAESYFNISNPQTIYVRLENETGCSETTSFDLIVNNVADDFINFPDANFKIKLISLGLDTNSDGEIQYTEAANLMPVLDVSGSFISNLEGFQFFPNVTSLYCNNNQLTALNLNSNTNLTFVNCNNNQISTLNVNSNSNLVDLLANNNQLSNISLSNHPNLETLWLSNNQLQNLNVSSCIALKELSVGNNSLVNLNLSMNTMLDDLQCSQNQLLELDLTNNSNLLFLNCGYNQLASLELTSLENLETLYCSFNNLVDLDCSSNYNLTAIGFVGNPLETINIKNGSDESLNVDSGSWWENWSEFNSPNLIYVCADEFQVENINSIVNTTNTNVNSFCTLGLANNANVLNVSVKFDSNNNGCEDQDVQIPYFGFVVNDVPNTTESLMFTNNLGQLNFFSNLATDYEVTPWIENPSYFNVTPEINSVNFPSTTNNQESLTFCVTANGVYQDLEVIIVPIVPAKPGFQAVYKIVYRNKGNQTINTENAVTFSYNDDLLDFVEASIVPETNTTGMLSWLYNDLKPFEVKSIEVTLYVNPPTDPDFPVNIDDQLAFSATISPSGTADETPDDNSVTFNQSVVGSYDPNNIICLQGETAPVDLIGDYLYYVINFENTGNSEAVNILVNSLINDSYYDINSLRVIESSHNVNTKIENNQVDFYFENIYLEGGGHGNILLKMATNPGLQVNDFVKSKANIYFDYNFPILTNDATTTFAVLSADNFDPINAFKIYPNPVADILFIQAIETIKSVELYDQMGRLVSVKLPNESEIEMDLTTQQTPGVYFVKITTQSYTKTEKLIVK